MDVLSTPFPEQVLPQLRWELSFRPYLEYIEAAISGSKSVTYSNYLKAVAAIIKRNPVLLEPIENFDLLNEHSELLTLIKLNHIQPELKGEEPMYAMGTPFPMKLFSYSDSFRSLILDEMDAFRSCLSCEFAADDHQRKLYWLILEKCYGVTIDHSLHPDTFLRMTDQGADRRKYYRFSVNHHFVDVNYQGHLPPLRQEWVDYATGVIRDPAGLDAPMDLEMFTAEGFMIFTVSDETEEMALQDLRKTIADMHTIPEATTFINIRRSVLSLLGDESVELGVLPFVQVNEQYRYHSAYNQTSVLFRALSREMPQEVLSSIFQRLLGDYLDHSAGRRLIYNSLQESAGENEVEQLMNRCGFQSLGIFPIWHGEKLLGILEIAGKEPQAINARLIQKVEEALPLCREYLTYQLGKLSERMTSYIMQRYTAIQPSVQWKFNESAWQAFQQETTVEAPQETGSQETGAAETAAAEHIRFDNLLPFHGTVDVRNSSVERLNAVRQDLWLQLEYLDELLDIAGSAPGIADMRQKVQRWQQLINLNITLEEEVDLRDFLEESVRFIGELKRDGKVPGEEARRFESKMHDESSDFHAASWGFEQSLQKVNETLKDALETASRSLQERIPHYFEKFKSDGWEFNLYAGDSISPWRSFTVADADAICRWQLDTLIAMAAAAQSTKKQLPFRLDTTQLTFVHSHPVAISYRTDERRFDVEGAYSIRYEVIKKRIDKVRIRGSEERLTQPGALAIVYVHSRDVVRYRKHLRALISEGRLLPGIEMLDLEDLQGISGLKALRVRLNYWK